MLLTALPVLLYIGLIVYSVFDALQTPADELYRLTRGQWIAAIVLVPLFGAVLWLLASGPRRGGRHEHAPGHPAGTGWAAEGMTQYPVGPDDDPDFIAGLARAQRKRTLTRPDETPGENPEAKPSKPDDEPGETGA